MRANLVWQELRPHFALLVISAFGIGLIAVLLQPIPDYAPPKNSRAIIEHRGIEDFKIVKEIQAELKEPGTPSWAGYYRNFNARFLSEVWVAPKSGWLARWEGHWGGGGFSSGDIQEREGVIEFIGARADQEMQFKTLQEVQARYGLNRMNWKNGKERVIILKHSAAPLFKVDETNSVRRARYATHPAAPFIMAE